MEIPRDSSRYTLLSAAIHDYTLFRAYVPTGSAAVQLKARELVGSRATVTVMDVWRAASPGGRLTFTLRKLPSWGLCRERMHVVDMHGFYV